MGLAVSRTERLIQPQHRLSDVLFGWSEFIGLLEILDMNQSKWKLGTLAAMAVAASTFVLQAQAAPVISVIVTPSSVAFGGPVGIDITVSGLTGAIGAYAFDLNYDGTRLSFASFLADPDTKMGDGTHPAINFSGGNSGSSVNFDVLAGFFLPADEATLAGLQGTGFRLGHVGLTALPNAGFGALTLTGYSLSNYDGTATIAGVTVVNSQVCVSASGTAPCTNAVPEPTTPLLVFAALGGALAFSRKHRRG
jgi:hypothetical protein